MDSREEFELWFETHTVIAGLPKSLAFEKDAAGEYMDADVFMHHRGWQARQPEIDKKDEQIKLLRAALVQMVAEAKARNCGLKIADEALEATKGE